MCLRVSKDVHMHLPGFLECISSTVVYALVIAFQFCTEAASVQDTVYK